MNNETFNTGLMISADAISRKKAYKRSLELMDKQYDMDERAWQRVQDYNTPMMQMKRLKEAGLNPALMYGQGTTGNAQQQIQSKFNELEPFTSGQTIASSTAAGVQMSMADAVREKTNSEATLNAIRGANETDQLEIARSLARNEIDYRNQKIRESQQSIEESKDRVLTGQANRKQIQSSITNDVVNRMATMNNIRFTNAQIKQTNAATKQILTNTKLAQQMFNMDYTELTGRNWMANFEKLANGAYPKDTMIGGASILSTLMIAKNPMAVLGPAGKGGKLISQLAKKNSKKLNLLIKQAKSYVKYKLGMKGWLNP